MSERPVAEPMDPTEAPLERDTGEGDDAELADLPRPPRLMRTVTVVVMTITALLASWLALSLWPEAVYALRAPAAQDVGVLPAADLGALDGGFVRGYAQLEGVPTASYHRPLEGGSYRVALASPVEGDQPQSRVWVIYRVPASQEGPRFVPPQLVAGRLTRVGDLGIRFQGVSGVLAELGGVQAGDWVLIDGETPSALGWVLGLEVLLLLFIAFNAVSVARVLRPLRPEPSRPTD